MMFDKQTLVKIKNKGFDKQRAVFADKSKRIALFVGRRSGKTYTIAVLFLLFALIHQHIRLIFIGLTGQNAEDAFMPAMMGVLREFKLVENQDYAYNNTERLITFLSTGSTISLKGYDTSYKEMDKILGGKCFAVAIDECQSQTQDIEKAILYKIQPAVSDYLPVGGGIIILAGTAGDYMGNNYWYRVTSEQNHLGWSLHHWLDKENPHMLEAKLMEDGMFEQQYGANFREEQDWYKQQYLCQWLTGQSNLVYRYEQGKNALGSSTETEQALLHSLEGRSDQWRYLLGADFGYEDSNAIVIGAVNPYDPNIYIVESYKQNHMQLDEIAELIQHYRDTYKPSFMVCDAQDKIVVETLRQKHKLPLLAADKQNKFAHTASMNSDFAAGKIQVIEANNLALIDEWAHLTWSRRYKDQGVYKENPTRDNHLADACLYMHHFSRHHRAIPAPKDQAPLSEMARKTVQQFQQANDTFSDFDPGF